MMNAARNHAAASSAVTPRWLAKRIEADRASIRVVDTRTEGFRRSHIPGAVSLDVVARLFDDEGNVVSAPELALVMSSLGVGDAHTIVVVGDGSGRTALAAAWALERYGHFDVHVLEGGYARWIAEGNPTTTEIVRHPIASYTAKVLSA